MIPQLVEQTPLLRDEGAQLGDLEEYALELVGDAFDRDGELRAPIFGRSREPGNVTLGSAAPINGRSARRNARAAGRSR